jgi:parallel beta-helix repeat protein
MGKKVLLLSVLVCFFVFPSFALAADITDCQEITASGDYTITADIIGHSGTCFNIKADDVNFDCNDKTISGDGTGSGILLSSRTGVTIENCNIEHFDNGINLGSSDGNIITNLHAKTNEAYGIRLLDSDSNTITYVTVEDNGHQLATPGADKKDGIILQSGSHNNILTNINADGNARNGIWIAGGKNNEITESVLENNGRYGIFVQSSGGYDVTRYNVHDNTYHTNTYGGFGTNECGKLYEDTILTGDILEYSIHDACFKIKAPLELNCKDYNGNYRILDGIDTGAQDGIGSAISIDVGGSTVRNCNIKEFDYGIVVLSDGNTIIDTTSNSNRRYGIILNPASGNTLTNIKTNYNTDGILLYTQTDGKTSSNNVLTTIMSNSNTRNGINIANKATGNILTGINTHSNGEHGINIATLSSGNKLTTIFSKNNLKNGISISSSDDNILEDISVSDNGVDSDADGVKESGDGIRITTSNNNELTNIRTNHNYVGVYLHKSTGNTVTDINSKGNYNGFQIYNHDLNTDSNILTESTFDSNTNRGIAITRSDGNTIHSNNFLNVGVSHAYEKESTNTWHDSMSETGNYWDDYTGADDGSRGRLAGNGIGDTNLPYSGVDNFPLMKLAGTTFPIVIDIITPVGTTHSASQVLMYKILWGSEQDVWYNIDDGTNITITGKNNIPLHLGEGTFTLNIFSDNYNGVESMDSVTFTIEYSDHKNKGISNRGDSYSGSGTNDQSNPETTPEITSDISLEIIPTNTEIQASESMGPTGPTGFVSGITNLISPGVSIVVIWIMTIIAVFGAYKVLGIKK